MTVIRLVGGSSSREGRVEVFYAGVWGTVCNAGWGTSDANVVCRQLGFSRGTAITTSSRFGQGVGPTWMNNVNCGGGETRLHSCSFSGWGASQCRDHHSRDAGVVCSGTGQKWHFLAYLVLSNT